jgi:hypothetical protein
VTVFGAAQGLPLFVAWQLLRAKTKREPFSGAIYYGDDSGWR